MVGLRSSDALRALQAGATSARDTQPPSELRPLTVSSSSRADNLTARIVLHLHEDSSEPSSDE